MDKNEWINRYGIAISDDVQSFGEVIKTKDGFIHNGTSLLVYPKLDNSWIFVEDMKETFNGMYFAKKQNDKSGYLFTAGFSKNGKMIGPELTLNSSGIKEERYTSKVKGTYNLAFKILNKKQRHDNPVISIYPKEDKFTIQGSSNRVIVFENNFLKLVKIKGNKELELIDAIDTDFKLSIGMFSEIEQPLYINSLDKCGIRPAYAKGSNDFYGAMMRYVNGELRYRKDKDDNVIFLDDINSVGIYEYNNGSKYFGNAISNESSKFGEYKLSGFGCMRYKNKDAYIGSFSDGKPNGVGMQCDKDSDILLGVFKNGKKEGIFFKINDTYIHIVNYDEYEYAHFLYTIKTSDLSVEQFDGDCKFATYTASFDSPNKNAQKLINEKSKYRINPETLKNLDEQFTYIVDENGKIELTGLKKECTNDSFLLIPGTVTYIKAGAFKNLKKLKTVHIQEGVEVIEEGAFLGCPLEELILPNDVKLIEAYISNSGKLRHFQIPNGTGRIKSNAFIECKNLLDVRLAPLKDAIIEKNAFLGPLNGGYNISDSNASSDDNTYDDSDEQDENDTDIVTNTINSNTRVRRKPKIKIIFNKILYILFFPFVWLFSGIKNFFTDILPDFFSNLFSRKSSKKTKKYKRSSSRHKYSYGRESVWSKIKDVLLSILTFPAKIFSGIQESPFSLIYLLPLISGVYIMLGITGWVKVFSWDQIWFQGDAGFAFGYNFELLSGCLSLISKGGFLTFLGIILFLFALILDLLVYIVLILVLYIIFVPIQILIQLILVFAIPVLIPIVLIIAAIKEEDKLCIVLTIITVAAAVTYYIFLIPLL